MDDDREMRERMDRTMREGSQMLVQSALIPLWIGGGFVVALAASVVILAIRFG